MNGLQNDVTFLHKALSNQQHYIDTVYETTKGLIQRCDVDDLLEKILTKAGLLAGTPDTFLYLYDSCEEELVIKFGQGAYASFLGARIKPGQGLAGEVYTTGKPILIDDYATWSKRLKNTHYDKLHSALGIPLKSENRTIGVIGLGSFDPKKPFNPSDLHNLNRFAELASISLENARLNDDLQKELNERKVAENELRNLRNFLSNIINSMPSVLIGVDIHGTVTQWNKAAQEITGISSAEAHGKILRDVFPQMTSQMRLVNESIKSREIKQKLKVPHTLEGNNYYWDLTIYPLEDNCIEGAVIRIDDVTEKVHLEKMMVQTEKMLSLGGLAAGMAHEINNPLAGIIQTANLLSNRLDNKIGIPASKKAAEASGTTLDAIQKFMESRGILKMIDAIRESGKRVAEIVENMLNFARKDDSPFSYHHPVELLEKTLKIAETDYDLKKRYDFKAIEIVKEFDDNLPTLLCARATIQQVILNILRNGAQAMQEKIETIDGYSPKFYLRLIHEIDNDMLRIEIEDNGPGVEEEILNKIFEPFFTTKPVGVGTGLGLSISYFIITENHGGQMNIESIPGSGTKFVIQLPLNKQP